MSQDFWLLLSKFQLTTLTRLNRSPLSIRTIPIVYIVIVRRLVPSAVNQSLVVAVLKRWNYGNAAQAGLPSYLHRRLLHVHSSRSPACTSLRSFHRHSRQFSLSAINGANSVQAGEHRLPVTARTALGYLSSELAYTV
jgi:hypothetical protein